MATSNIVNTLGAGSGIDIKSLAESLVEAERAPRKERIDKKIAITEAKISAYGALKYALSELKSAFDALNDAGEISATAVKLSRTDSAKVTANAQAQNGSFELEILQTARGQRSASSTFSSSTDPLNGGSPFDLNISLGGKDPQTVSVATRTPAGVVEAINTSGTGLNATLIQADSTGQAWNIVVTGAEGLAQRFEITSDDGSGEPVAGLDFDTTLQVATDATLKLNGLTTTRSGNVITDLVAGLSIDLRSASPGELRVDVVQDNSSVKDKIRTLVSAYNALNETTRELTNPKSEVENVGGALASDSLVQSLRAQVRRFFTDNSSTPGTSIRAARDIGLTLDRFGTLQFDERALDSALQDHPAEVVQMLTANTNGQSVYSSTPAGLSGDALKRLDGMLRSTGMISTHIANGQKRIEDYKTELESLDLRMSQLMERYTAQFSLMDTIVGQNNALRSSLSSSFDGLMAMYKSN